MQAARRIRVQGRVQGVGYRPFVWRMAHDLGLSGWVRNDSGGVEIAVEGPAERVAVLEARLGREAPPRARIDGMQACSVAPSGLPGFVIAASERTRCATGIGPDTATCPECLAELFDPGNRRWRHAFITCTHCGPRYTLVRALPYDRAATGMAGFPMCADCAREYGDPADRRFHAEPIACPACGPRLALADADGRALPGDPVAGALALLRAGHVLALKGLGGYHLACDATQPAAVARLRERKRREAKPFALMAANAASLAAWMHVDAMALAALRQPAAPVVLLPRRVPDGPPGIADGLAELGAMLPGHPLQWLLFHEAAGRPAGTGWMEAPQPLLLVMTSANASGEPLAADDADARRRLAGIADGYLGHDRPIIMRCDDSVVRPGAVVRRARGLAPDPVPLPRAAPPVLAVGAHLKSTACVTRGAEAFLTQHVGDLDGPEAIEFLEECIAHLLRLLEVQPAAVAHDLHPDMPSTRLAMQLAAQWQVPLVGVQHHHAHIAAVLAEHGHEGRVLGFALDGMGHGSDGTAWGGELLEVDGAAMHRVGSLVPLALPGGDRAAREPWRMAAAALHALGRGGEIGVRLGGEPQAQALAALLERGSHCPPTSSLGRVFDAAAGLLGVCTRQAYEAEAAQKLEALARSHGPVAAPAGAWRIDSAGRLDLLPLLALLADWRGRADAAAAVFHAALAEGLAAWATAGARLRGLDTLALGGGCLLNALLRESLPARLRAAGLRVLLPRAVPANDGAISLGQAWVAALQVNALQSSDNAREIPPCA